MKKILIASILLFLVAYSVFRYMEYAKYDTPTDFRLATNDSIDTDYHEQALVVEYLETCYRLGFYANEQWFNYKIDVRFADHENPQSVLASNIYRKMLERADFCERKLIRSAELKQQGFNNSEIMHLEETGMSVEDYRFNERFSDVIIQYGDKGEDVEMLQESLNNQGYEIMVDGYYKNTTKQIIKRYQVDHGLFPTGSANEATLKLIFNNQNK